MTCVKAATEEDRALEAQVKAMFPHLMNRGLLKPSGELTPRFCHILTFFRALWYILLNEIRTKSDSSCFKKGTVHCVSIGKQNMRQ